MITTMKSLRSYLLVKLNTIYSDINASPERTNNYLNEIKSSEEDKRKIIMDIYARYYSPVKVTDLSGRPKRQCDMTGEMLDFSENFDKYIASIEEEYSVFVKQKREAVALLALVLSLKQPYSKILYLKYYKRLSPADMCTQMHIARSTLFRKRNEALSELAELFAASNDIVLVAE